MLKRTLCILALVACSFVNGYADDQQEEQAPIEAILCDAQDILEEQEVDDKLLASNEQNEEIENDSLSRCKKCRKGKKRRRALSTMVACGKCD